MLDEGCLSIIRFGSVTSQSSLSADFFTYSPTLHNSSLRYFSTKSSRLSSLWLFSESILSPKFQRNQVSCLDSLLACVHNFANQSIGRTQRIGWASWVPTVAGDRWFAWQIVALLLLTNSVHDRIVHHIVVDMFTRFSNPISIAGNPSRFFDFLTSKAKDFQPSYGFNPQTDGISKGPNYCYQKDNYIIAMSKTVILNWAYENGFITLTDFKASRQIYLDHHNKKAINTALPGKILQACLISNATLFPKEYHHGFYSSLPGIGLKMRHLCAEAIYQNPVGPAIDCHCIRFCVKMGTIHASMSLQQMSDSLVLIYPP